jgi:carbonic anhydrase/acetyltransferase-like protein (isoleucine patch superfamily)
MYIMDQATVLTWKGHRPQLADDVFIASGARLMGQLSIGALTNIWFNTVLRGDVNFIRIGANTNIQDNTTVHVDSKKYPTIIGDDVTIGHNAIVHACTIGDCSLIGMGAVILDGAVIPEQSMVAAGALVSPGKTFPPRSLIIGRPAKALRALDATELEYLSFSAQHYVKLSQTYYPSCSQRLPQ